MLGNSEMPTIEFGPDSDYNSLYALLYHINAGLGGISGEGAIFDFHFEGGGVVTGAFYPFRDDTDDMVIRLYDQGAPEDYEYATVDTDLIEKLVYQ